MSLLKLAIYQKEGSFATVLDDISNPRIEGSKLTYDGGYTYGIDENHILIDDDVTPPETLEEAKLIDQKAYYSFEKVDKIADLEAKLQVARQENEMNALALMELAELVLGG